MKRGFELGIQASNQYGFDASNYHEDSLDPLVGGFVTRLRKIGVSENKIDYLLTRIKEKADGLGVTLTPQILAPGFGEDTDEALRNFLDTGDKKPGAKSINDDMSRREEAVIERFEKAIGDYMRFLAGRPASKEHPFVEPRKSLVPLATAGMDAPISTQEVHFFAAWVKEEIQKILDIGNMDVRDICENVIEAITEETEECIDEIADIFDLVKGFFAKMQALFLNENVDASENPKALLEEKVAPQNVITIDVDSVRQHPRTKRGPTLPRRIMTGLYVQLVALFTQLQAWLLNKKA